MYYIYLSFLILKNLIILNYILLYKNHNNLKLTTLSDFFIRPKLEDRFGCFITFNLQCMLN